MTPRRTPLILLLAGGLLLLCGVVLLATFAAVNELTCERPAGGEVTCTRTIRLLGLPLGRETISPFVDAFVDEQCDVSGCNYRVLLDTGSDLVPLTAIYNSDQAFIEQQVAELNAFIEAPERPSLTLSTNRHATLLIVPALLALVGGIMVVRWRRLKSANS